MKRYTKQEETQYVVLKEMITKTEVGYTGPAIEQLAKYENALDSMYQQVETLTAKLEKMKQEDNTKSYTFRETMALKGMNKNLIALFETYLKD